MRSAALLILALFLSSCSPVRGYQGPELPKEQVALIYSITHTGLERDSLKVDGGEVSYFSTGITVLPGVHDVEMAFRTKVDASSNCYSCDSRWVCHGSFNAEAGKEYKLKAVAGGVWIFEDESDTPSGSLSCREIGGWW